MNNFAEITIPEDVLPEEAAQKAPVIISQSMSSLKQIQEKIQETKKAAEEAKEKAKDAWLKDVGFWHSTTPALEALQRAGKSQSEALINVIDCQELLFKQQFILAQCTKYLFMLCCSNLSSARIAVKEIQASLRGASEEEISEIARNELQKTLQQLKQQMDLLEQQERLKNKVEKLDTFVSQQNEKITRLESFIHQIPMNRDHPDIEVVKPCNQQNEQNHTNRKTIYILLAIFLGSFGIHDLYAGKILNGIIKICITLLSGGMLFWISFIWAIIDIVIVCCDKNFFTTKWHIKKQMDTNK